MQNSRFLVQTALNEIPIFSYRADTDGSFLQSDQVICLQILKPLSVIALFLMRIYIRILDVRHAPSRLNFLHFHLTQ